MPVSMLVDTAVESEQELIKPYFQWKHNGRPAGNGWNRSVNNARYGVDYFNRAGTSKSNLFDNKPTAAQYCLRRCPENLLAVGETVQAS